MIEVEEQVLPKSGFSSGQKSGAASPRIALVATKQKYLAPLAGLVKENPIVVNEMLMA
jgi:hypothetical protein